MRIIAGTARGRRLLTPGSGGNEIRPTADRAREAIFSILGEHVRGAAVLDLFAGTGAMGLEALSRGAQSAHFVDIGKRALDLLYNNIQRCGFWQQSTVVRRDVTRGLFFLRSLMPVGGFSLVFIDPPYKMALAAPTLRDLEKEAVLCSGAVIAVETRSGDESLPQHIGSCVLFDHRIYGEAGFWLYECRLSHNEQAESREENT